VEWIHFPRIRTFVEKRFHGLFPKRSVRNLGVFLRLNRFQEENTVLAVISLPIGQPTDLDPYQDITGWLKIFKDYYPRNLFSGSNFFPEKSLQKNLSIFCLENQSCDRRQTQTQSSLFSISVLLCSFMSPPPSVFSNRKRKNPQRGRGRTLERMQNQFNTITSPHLAQCAVLLWIRLIQAIWFASDFLLSSVHIVPPCVLLFLSAVTRFLEKGKFSDRSWWLVLQESCLRCSKNLRIRMKFEV